MTEAQLKKGVLEMCVLFCIHDKKLYGYDVMKTMKEYFPEVNESTFYVILRRLHADGAAEVTIGDTSLGPTRKYYGITEKGREALKSSMDSWRRIRGVVRGLGIE